jgi:hypothetical protein
MPGFNHTGPAGQGPMTGRGMGECNPSPKGKIDDNVKNAITVLVSALIIGLAEKVWTKIREKRLKNALK